MRRRSRTRPVRRTWPRRSAPAPGSPLRSPTPTRSTRSPACHQDAGQDRRPELAGERVADPVVADAERARNQQARRQIARELLADWRWFNQRIATVEGRLSQLLGDHGTSLTDLHGIAEVGAATIIGVVGDPRRFPSAGHFAAYNATAPVEASSGEVRRHRRNRGGHRRLNAVLHTAAVIQVRDHAAGRAYYDRKLAEGKT